jgi:hypothetical protein
MVLSLDVHAYFEQSRLAARDLHFGAASISSVAAGKLLTVGVAAPMKLNILLTIAAIYRYRATR